MNRLTLQYKQLLNLQDSKFSLIEHEDAMVGLVYRVTLTTGVEYILKICSSKGEYLREVYFLKYFEGKIPVPGIIQQVEPGNIHGAVLMECLSGNLLNRSDINETLAYEIGCILAKIHSAKTPGYGDLTQPEQLSADPCIPFTQKFEEGLAECKDHLPKSMIDQSQITFDRHLNLLVSVDGPCIVHRDFRLGNLMVFNSQIQGVIDWSSGRGGFAEEDFYSLELEKWPSSPAYTKALLAGYASIRSVPQYQELTPLLTLNKAIAVIGFTVKRETWKARDSAVYRRYRNLLDHCLKYF